MFGCPRIVLRLCAAALSDAREDNIHVSDPDVQVRRIRHAEIVRESLGDVVREKWKSGDSAEVEREDDPAHAAFLRTGAREPLG